MSDNGRLNFSQTLSRLLAFGAPRRDSRNRLEALRALLPDSLDGNRGIGLTKSCLNNVSGSFYQWQVKRMFGQTGDGIRFGRLENIRDDLLSLFEQCGVAVDAKMKDEVFRATPVNASPHRPYQDYYSHADQLHVATAEADIIKRFDYRF